MLVQTGPMGIDERDDGTADRADPDPESYLANSVLVVGDAGMASARSLAQLGYDVRLAQLGADERLEIVWRSDEQGVTIELEDHHVEHVDLVYVAETVTAFVRVVRVARQIGATAVWSPFADHDNVHRHIVEGAGLVFVAGADIVVVARRHARRRGLQRLEIVETLLMASTRWREIGEVVADSENRPDAFARLQAAFDLSEVGANFVLDMNMGSLTRLALQELRTERAHLDDALGSGSGE